MCMLAECSFSLRPQTQAYKGRNTFFQGVHRPQAFGQLLTRNQSAPTPDKWELCGPGEL